MQAGKTTSTSLLAAAGCANFITASIFKPEQGLEPGTRKKQLYETSRLLTLPVGALTPVPQRSWKT